jgi:hypothetical protein
MAGINVPLRYVLKAIAITSILSAAGCATNNANVASYFIGGPPKPKTVVVGEFEVAPGTVSVDHALAPSYRRKLAKATPDQLKAELATAIDEAVADAMVTTLTDGGLPATVGGQETVNTDEQTIIVTGRVRKLDDKDRMRRKVAGLAPAHGTITADVQVNQQQAGTSKELLAFGDVDVAGKLGPATAGAPATTGSIPSEKLTPSAAAEARRIGRASANRILAFATEQGWINHPTANAQAQVTQ